MDVTLPPAPGFPHYADATIGGTGVVCCRGWVLGEGKFASAWARGPAQLSRFVGIPQASSAPMPEKVATVRKALRKATATSDRIMLWRSGASAPSVAGPCCTRVANRLAASGSLRETVAN